MTDNLDVGAIVWSRVRRGNEARENVGGMVVADGVTEGGEPYVIVLDEGVSTPIKAWRVRNRVVARRILLDDIDPSLTKPADKIRMVGGARGALLTVGCGSRMFSHVEKELCLYGATLMELATQ